MPELPEVETVRRGLEPVLVGKPIARVEQRRPDLRFPLPQRFAERLKGRTVEALDRRAKYLLARLDDGDVLVMHLGMTGRFSVTHTKVAGGKTAPPSRPFAEDGDPPTSPSRGEVKKERRAVKHVSPSRDREGGNPDAVNGVLAAIPTPKHEHIVFHMQDGTALRYTDARRFGYMDLIPAKTIDSHALFKGLGIEPLSPDFTPTWLAARLKGKKTSIKSALVDQRLIAGLGNIYACEALHRARISPLTLAGALATRSGKPTKKTEALVEGIKAVLESAIKAGGSSLRDYRHTDGRLGRFQHRFKVYGREGKPCQRAGCGGVIRRIVQGGRSTFYCPTCQR